jgi:hypothetical protein
VLSQWPNIQFGILHSFQLQTHPQAILCNPLSQAFLPIQENMITATFELDLAKVYGKIEGTMQRQTALNFMPKSVITKGAKSFL